MSEHRLEKLETGLGELLARREQGRDLAALRREYADENSPLGFDLPRLLQAEFGWRGYRKLDEAVQAVVAHPFSAIVSANGCGKSYLLGHLAIAFACMGWKAVCTSVGERSLQTQVMAHAFSAWNRAQLPGDFLTLGWRLSRDDERIVGFSSDAISRGQGHHSPVGVVVLVDEGQGLARDAVDELRSNCTGARRRFVLSGNPLRLGNALYDYAHSKSCHVTTIAAQDTPNVAAGTELIPGLVTLDFVLDTERDFGVGSIYYRSRVLAEWPTTDRDGLFDLDEIRAAIARPPRPGTPVVAGVDPSGGGAAWAVTILAGDAVVYLGAFHERDTTVALQRTVALVTQHGIAPRREEFHRMGNTHRDPVGAIAIDEGGLGLPLAQLLARAGYRVHGVNFGGTPTRSHSPTTEYLNLRSQLYYGLRDRLRRRTLSLPASRDTELLAEELMATHVELNAERRLKVEEKSKIMARLGSNRSPDRADSLALAIHAAEEAAGAQAFLDLSSWSREVAIW